MGRPLGVGRGVRGCCGQLHPVWGNSLQQPPPPPSPALPAPSHIQLFCTSPRGFANSGQQWYRACSSVVYGVCIYGREVPWSGADMVGVGVTGFRARSGWCVSGDAVGQITLVLLFLPMVVHTGWCTHTYRCTHTHLMMHSCPWGLQGGQMLRLLVQSALPRAVVTCQQQQQHRQHFHSCMASGEHVDVLVSAAL